MTDGIKPFVIVVGIDYSELGDLALERALELALEKTPAEVHVLQVLPPPVVVTDFYVPDTRSLVADATDQLRRHVESKVTAFRARRGADRVFRPRVLSHVRVSAPVSEIAQFAADLEADIAIVGTHGRRGMSRFVLGSVAEATVRLAPCPVLVMRPRTRPLPVPAIEPPCHRCIETRNASVRREVWCQQHREHHGQRPSYRQDDPTDPTAGMPLLHRSQ